MWHSVYRVCSIWVKVFVEVLKEFLFQSKIFNKKWCYRSCLKEATFKRISGKTIIK